MVDKVKVLVGQRDSEELQLSEEIKPSSDFMSTKGLAFEGLDTHLIQKLGRAIDFTVPNHSVKPTYTNDDITKIECFNGFTQTTINRISSLDVSYTNDLVTSEVYKVYDTDGATVLKTATITHSYTNEVVTNTQVSYT